MASADLFDETTYLIAPRVAAQVLGVTRQRIDQLMEAGYLSRVPIMGHYIAIPWADVVDRLVAQGKPILSVPPPIQECDRCGKVMVQLGGHHHRVLKRWRCSVSGCSRSVLLVGQTKCSRCRNGYAPGVPQNRLNTIGADHCSRCGRMCSPQRTKTCRLRGFAPICVGCLSPKGMNARRYAEGLGRVNGIVPGGKSDT